MNMEQNFNEQILDASNIPSFLSFSNELILHIVSFLGPAELLTLGQTCKFLKFIADENEFWHPLFTKYKKKPCLISSRAPLLRGNADDNATNDENSQISDSSLEFMDENQNSDFSEADYGDNNDFDISDSDFFDDNNIDVNDVDDSDDNNYSDFFQLKQHSKKPQLSQCTSLNVKSIVDASNNYYNWKQIFLKAIEYETLENALNNAVHGDVIILPKGRYTIDHYCSINKSIDIIGDDFSEMNTKYFAFFELETPTNKNSMSVIHDDIYILIVFFIFYFE
jgi:hypothetical protein